MVGTEPEHDWVVRVPASSANIGAGFDVLGMALTLHADIGTGDAPDATVAADHRHPAKIAFERLGGSGPLWVRSPIPMGRGLGFSGAMRVGGAAAAVVQQLGRDALADDAQRDRIMAVTAQLEGHGDNVAASLHGGVVVAVDGQVGHVPLAIDPAIVVWVPGATATSTDHSRTRLEDRVTRDDAVFNLGRVGLFVTACATGDVSLLRTATQDRIHQATRLALVPDSAGALDAGVEAGAWAAWLSGSGPTVAMMCDPDDVDEIVAALPATGHTKRLHIDHAGATVVNLTTG